MTAEDLADLIGATPVEKRRGIWKPPCPVHGDDGRPLRIMNLSTGDAVVTCPSGCSIHEILKRWHLTQDDYTSRPVEPPNENEVTEEEYEAYRAKDRERQVEHGDVCLRLRAQRKEVARLLEKLEVAPAERRPVLERKLNAAQAELRSLKEEERQLRAPGTCPKPRLLPAPGTDPKPRIPKADRPQPRWNGEHDYKREFDRAVLLDSPESGPRRRLPLFDDFS